MENDGILEFEDFFEIVTPGGVDSRVSALDLAWVSLENDNPFNSYIQSEYKKWTIWKDQILDYSWLTKTWANGILSELDDWHRRYNYAYIKAENRSNAPVPEGFDGNNPNPITSNPWFWVAVAAGGTIAGLTIYYKLIK